MHDRSDRLMEDVIREDGRYPPQAYAFLHEGIKRAVRDVCGEEAVAHGQVTGQQYHVTGQQMCHGLRELALERWGMLARCVLERWNIHATIDFGNMVYLLIRYGFWRKTDEDSCDDFRDVFDFREAFDIPSEFELKE